MSQSSSLSVRNRTFFSSSVIIVLVLLAPTDRFLGRVEQFGDPTLIGFSAWLAGRTLDKEPRRRQIDVGDGHVDRHPGLDHRDAELLALRVVSDCGLGNDRQALAANRLVL